MGIGIDNGYGKDSLLAILMRAFEDIPGILRGCSRYSPVPLDLVYIEYISGWDLTKLYEQFGLAVSFHSLSLSSS